jgi:arginyl-tRNA synthetase
VQIANLAISVQARLKGLKPGDAGWPERPTTATTSPTSPRLPGRQDRAAPTTAAVHRQRRPGRSGRHPQFAVAYLRHEQDLDLQAFGVRFDHYYLESSLYSSGRVETDGAAPGGFRQDLRGRRRAVAAQHRLR